MKSPLFAALALAGLTAAPAAWATDPTVGACLSATETSLHLRSSQLLREARAQLLICSAATCPSEVREECLHRMGELNAAQPTVVFAVKTRAGQELTAVKVTMDGQVVANHLDGSALSLNPGSHEFTFEPEGQSAVAETIILHEGEKAREETVVVETPPPATPGAEGRGAGRRTFGIVIGAGGLVALAVGGVFGAAASSAWKTANGECPSHSNCGPKAISDRNTASTFATVSTVGVIAGGVLLAGGLGLYFTAPKDKSPRVGLEVTAPAGLLVTGTF